jgi:superfamily II DNA helicase RecQ
MAESRDPLSKRRAAQEEARQEVRRAKAARMIRRTQGDHADVLLEALGLDGPAYVVRQCPHCHEPFKSGDGRCKKQACQAKAREIREGYAQECRVAEEAS